MRSLRTALALGMALFFTAGAFAQAWPSRPIKFIVPFPPGGPTDIIGRSAAQILQTALGQPVIVDNRAGGTGTVGLDALAKSSGDGYTVGLTAITLNFESSLTMANANIKAGKLKPIAMLTEKRSQLLPDVPTAVELGYPTVSAAPWWGLGGPARLPREMVSRMNAAIVQGLRSKEVVDRLAAVGIEATPSTPEEFNTFLHAEYTRWGNLIQRAGIKSQ